MVTKVVFQRTEEGEGSCIQWAKENSVNVEGFGNNWRPVRTEVIEKLVDWRNGGLEESGEVFGERVVGFVEDGYGVGGKGEGDEVKVLGDNGEGGREGLECGNGDEGNMVPKVGNAVDSSRKGERWPNGRHGKIAMWSLGLAPSSFAMIDSLGVLLWSMEGNACIYFGSVL